MDSRFLLTVSVVFIICDFSIARHNDNLLSAARYLVLPEGVEVQLFPQRLDHFPNQFSDSNLVPWDQRYMEDRRWFNGTGPIFLNIGGEGPMPSSGNYGTVADYTKKFGALLFNLEHRFYGRSIPGPLNEYFRYLNSQQALGDIAYFIKGMKTLHNLYHPNNKWVVFGGSYAGTLAAWARQQYPGLVHAAVSVSAPMWAQVENKGYDQVVREALGAQHEQCAENVHNAALQLEDSLRDGKLDLYPLFNFPYNAYNDEYKIAYFTDSIAETIRGIVQYNNADPEQMTVADVCKIMLDENFDLIQRYANVYKEYTRNRLQEVHNPGNIPGDTSASQREAWSFQVCNEFGWFPTSSSRNELFGSSLTPNFYIDTTCSRFPGFTPADIPARLINGIWNTNMMHHGLNFEVSRVVFIHGSLDPWSRLGVRISTPLAPVIIIPGTSHCQFLAPSHNYDPGYLALANARYDVEILLQTWLSQQF